MYSNEEGGRGNSISSENLSQNANVQHKFDLKTAILKGRELNYRPLTKKKKSSEKIESSPIRHESVISHSLSAPTLCRYRSLLRFAYEENYDCCTTKRQTPPIWQRFRAPFDRHIILLFTNDGDERIEIRTLSICESAPSSPGHKNRSFANAFRGCFFVGET